MPAPHTPLRNNGECGSEIMMFWIVSNTTVTMTHYKDMLGLGLKWVGFLYSCSNTGSKVIVTEWAQNLSFSLLVH